MNQYILSLIIVSYSFFSFALAQDRRVNLTGQRVYLEKKGDAIYYGADELSDYDDGVSWMRGFRNKLDEIDGKTFSLVSGTFCGKDKNGVYVFFNSVFERNFDLDPHSFVPLSSMCYYGRDYKIIKSMYDPQYVMYEMQRDVFLLNFLYTGSKHHVSRMGMDNKYMYFTTINGSGFIKDSLSKIRFDAVVPVFEKELFSRFDHELIRKALLKVSDNAYKKGDITALGIISAMYDTFYPLDDRRRL